MARTAATPSNNDRKNPKDIRRIGESRSQSSLSVPPKKLAKLSTPKQSKRNRSSVGEDLNPRVLLSRTLEFSGLHVDEIRPSVVKITPKKSQVKKMKGSKEKFLTLVTTCIWKLKDRNGSSRAAILNQLKLDFAKQIGSNEANINLNLKLALKKGLEDGILKMAKKSGKGSGSYKLTPKELKKLNMKTPSVSK